MFGFCGILIWVVQTIWESIMEYSHQAVNGCLKKSGSVKASTSSKPVRKMRVTPGKKKIYTDWANHFLEKAGNKQVIADLQVDITNGVLLAKVIEAVIDEKVSGIHSSPRTSGQMIDNLEKCLRCLSSKNISIQGITARQLREGNLKAVLGLFFALSRHKQQLQQEEQQRKQAAKQQNTQKQTSNTSKQPSSSGSQLPRRNPSTSSSTTSKSSTQSSKISIPKVQSSQSSSRTSRPPSQNLSSSRPTSATSSKLLATQSQSRSSSPSSRQSSQSSRTNQGGSQSRNSQSQSKLSSQSQSRSSNSSQSRPSSQSHSRPGSQSHSRPTSQTSLSGQPLSVSRPASSRSSSQSRPTSQCSSSGLESVTPRSRSSSSQKSSQGSSATSGLQKRLSSTSVGQISGSSHSRNSTSSSVDMSSRIPTRGLQGPNTNQNRLSSGSEKSRNSISTSPSNSLQAPKASSKMSSNATSTQRTSRPPSKLKGPSSATKSITKPEPPQRTTSIKQSQMTTPGEKTVPTSASAGKEKGSMLTKLKLFSGEKGKEGEGAKTPSKLNGPDSKQTVPVGQSKMPAPKSSSTKSSSSKTSKLQGPRKSGDFSKQSSKMSMSSSPKRRSSSSDIKKTEIEVTQVDKGQNGSPKSSLKAVAQKTIGKAFGANGKSKESPKASRKNADEADQSEQLKERAILSDTGYESMDKPKESEVRTRKSHGHESSDDGYLSAASTNKNSKIAVPPSKIIAPPSSTSGKSQMTKVKPIQKGGGKTSKSSGIAVPKSSKIGSGAKELGSPLDSPFQRGGVYSTFPAPSPSGKSAPSPSGKIESPVTMRVQETIKEGKGSSPSSPSHKSSLPPSPSRGLRTPANTATVAPFNYSASKLSEDGNCHTPINSQVSVSSNTSQSSENSVIFKQKSIEEEICTTEYENDKVVTTFGTPKSQRAHKGANGAIPNQSNMLVMKVQSDMPPRAIKETTFGDSVTTQVKTQGKIIPQFKEPISSEDRKLKKESYSKIAIGNPVKPTPAGTMSSVQSQTSSPRQNGRGHQSSAQRFLPAPSLTKLHQKSSMRRTFSNRSHLSDAQYSETGQSRDGSECASEDVVNGYVSDGDVLHKNGPLSDISGYMSEGGSTLYARRMGTLFRGRDGMAALREYLQKPISLSDDESLDSSSISSGALSDTINEISTDENVTGSSSRNSFESGKNLEIFGDEIIVDDFEGIPSRTIDPGDGYLSDSRLKVAQVLRAVSSRRSSAAATDGGIGLSDSHTMSRIEIRKSTATPGGSTPPSWQRSLDRLQARHRTRPDSSLTAAQQKSLVSSRGALELARNQSKGATQGTQVGPRGQSSTGTFGYRKTSPSSNTAPPVGGKSGLSPAGLAAQKSIKDTINKLSLKANKSEQSTIKKTSPPGLQKKNSPGTAPPSRLKATLGGAKTPTSQTSVWMKQSGSDSKSRSASNNIKTGSLKRTSPSGSQSILSQTSPTSKSDKNVKDPALKNLFNRKGDLKLSGKDTIISNPHATLSKKASSPVPPRNSLQSHVNGSDTDSYSPRTQRALSTVDPYSKIPYDDGLSAFSGYMSDSFASNKTYGYPSIPYASQAQTKYASGNHSFLSKRPETASMESLESNNSSAYSVASHAMSEQVGPTYRHGSSISRSPSLRSTLSERQFKPHLSLFEKNAGQVDWMSGNYPNVSGDRTSVQLSPTESTLSHPPMSFFPVAMGGVQSQPMLSRQLRNGSLSLDERQRAALSICALLQEGGTEDFKGSSQSLMSTSSLYSTPEERAASEIHRLKRDLEREQDRVSSLSRNLNTNAHVVAAFEQSLSGMTNRLQQLTSSTEQKDSELQDLREKIEQLKVAHTDGRNGSLHHTNGSVDGLLRKHSLGNIRDTVTGEARLSRQTSCESMSSLASMTSMSSAGSAMTDTEVLNTNKKKKKNWIRSSFRSAFGRKKKASGTTTDVEDLDTSMTFANGAIHTQGQSQMKQSASTSALYDSEQSQETITDLKRQLRDKEGKLTDIKLEALSSQHQLDQMQEAMNKMKTEMMQLKQENERLQRQVQTNRRSLENASLNSLNSNGSSKRLSRDSLDRHRLSVNSDHGSGSLDILIDDNSGMTNNSQRIVVTVATSTPSDSDKGGSARKSPEVMIGTIGISSKTNWDSLDGVIRRMFKEYVLRIDPMTNLGLSAESVHHYIVGEITRSKDSESPELLPCGYLVGENTSIQISLKGFQHNSCDALVFETLVPKPILQRYISLLLEHKRIILCGPSGTGKTYLAQRLAEHIVQRNGKEPSEGCIATFNVDHKSGKELRQYLTHIADQCEANAVDLPTVIILDNLHNAGSLGEIFTGFLSYKYHKCPYIIGTMNQATCQSTNLQLHHNFRWILCANHMEPVKGFLGRYLRRKLIESEVKLNTRNNDLNKIIEWIPKVWQHLNKFLETHNSSDVTIGPRLFLSCPIDFPGSQVWFTDLWNYSIVPYLLEAVREGLQLYGRKAPWEDPSDWVIESYPWASAGNGDWSSLLRLRPEDIGFDGYKIQGTTPGPTGQKKAEVEGDPLFNMLMRLQEAANFSSTQSCESDNSLDSCGNSREDLRELESII